MALTRTIGIDASRWSVARLTGTETYTRQLLEAMAALDVRDPIDLYINASGPPSGLPAVGTPVCIPFPRFWTHARLSWQMLREPPGVLFVPAHVVPLVHPRSVVTIHDLGYLMEPDAHPPRQRRVLDLTTRWSVGAAKHVIAISAATKRDLVEHYHIDPMSITVIHHGVSPALSPATGLDIARVRQKLALPERYVFAVGTIHPRKNLARLAQAVRAIRDRGTNVELVVAGKRGWLAERVDAEIIAANATSSVRFLGYVEDSDLPALYSGAAAFAMPSLYEGFGLPILEAMACGTPVVAADNSAMPEVGGDAALYAGARDVSGWVASLERVLGDDALRTSLVERGLRHAAGFTWRTCAEQTLQVLRDVRDA